MKEKKKSSRPIGFSAGRILLLALIVLAVAGAGPLQAQTIQVSLLMGKAWISDGYPGASGESPLERGQVLQPGQKLRSDAGTKVELQISGMGVLRLGPSSQMRLSRTKAGAPPSAVLLSGNLWVDASVGNHRSPMEITMPTCTIKTTDGIFRITRYTDGTLEVKAYGGGTIRISASATASSASGGAASPAPAAWEYELPLHTQIVVWPNGSATRPFRFVAQADLTPWVRWNLQRDKDLGNNKLSQ